ncbi:MAG: porin family protein [Bacteroidota bacterium]
MSRKKIVITTLLIAGISFGSFAQQKKGDVEFGLNIGINQSTITNSIETADRRIGANLAGSLEYYFSNKWGIKTKLIFDQKGWNNGYLIDYNTGDEYVSHFRLNYITIPVMANWHFGKTGNWYLNFGPYFGFLSSATAITQTEGDIDVKELFESNDFGISYGIGVKIPVNNKIKFFIEVEGQGGFSELAKDGDEGITNSRGAINIGINFLMK